MLPSSPWPALLGVALAGTHRTAAPLVLPGLTPNLGAEADAPEKQLLLTAANLRLTQRAAQRPLAGPAQHLGRAGAETWPTLGPTAARLLHQLATGNFHDDVAPEFAQLMMAHRRRIPHKLLGLLVRQEAYFPDGHGQPHGRRGQWLGLQHPTEHIRNFARELLDAAPADAPAPDWQADLSAEAQEAAINRLRREPPADKWAWLLAVLPHQPPAGQLALLGLLPAWCALTGETPPLAFEPYLEAAKEQEQPWWVTNWLYQMPGSAQTARTWARLAPLLELRKEAADPAALPARRLHVVLPTGWNADWHHDGIRPNTYNNPTGFYEPYVLSELLGTVAPGRWTEEWQASPTEVVELWAHARYDRKPQYAPDDWPAAAARLALEGLEAAAVRFADRTLALELVRFMTRHPKHSYSAHGSSLSLYSLVPAPELMTWLQGLLPTLPAAPWTRMYRDAPYQTPKWFWEAEWLGYQRVPGLLPALLPLLRAHFAQLPHPDQQPMSAGLGKLVGDIAARGELSLLPWLEAELAAAPAPPALASLLQKALTTLALRRDLAASLHLPEPPVPDDWAD